MLVHQTRNTGALFACARRFATLLTQCAASSAASNNTLYQKTATGQYVELTSSQAADAASGDTQSSIGGSLPAFGVDPVFLQGSAFYNPDMTLQEGEQACICGCDIHL